MGKIKTKDAIKGTIKQLDRAAIVSDRMRRAYIQTKEKAETVANPAEGNVEDYASSRMESGTQTVLHESAHQIEKVGRESVSHVKEDVSNAKQAVDNFKSVRAEQRKTGKGIKTRESQMETAARTESYEPSVPKTHSEGIKQRSDGLKEPSERRVEQGRKRTVQSVRDKQRLGSQRSADVPSESVAGHEKPVIRSRYSGSRSHRIVEQTDKGVKESVKSAGKKSIKTTQRAAAKTAKRSIKTAEHTAKTTIKTTKEAAKATQKAAKASAKAAQKAAQAAKAAAKATAEGIKAAVKVTVAAIKAIIAATKALITAIAAGGWVAVMVIVIICLIGLVASSVFGIFFSGEDSGTGMTMQTAVQEINADYDARIEAEKSAVSYDSLEMSGSRAVWKEVLAVYSVKVNTDPDNPQEVATMDETKKQLLSNIFWEMNSISSRTETTTSTVTTETDDGHGNIVETETTETYTTLYITVSHKTVDEMAQQYGFTQDQKDYLVELLNDENNSLWSAVLYGIGYSDDQIVAVALSQIGNYGGEPYWSWYGFGSRVEWCACFVSWCANECGYIDTGVIPKYAGCTLGEQWFRDRGQWIDNSAEPAPGMIIFFDWNDENGQDGEPDHTGIVEKVENGTVYTVEGNSGDSVRINSYPIGYYEIYGYGVPQY